jgi:hypothetical protein
MDLIFKDFGAAQASADGYALARTLDPELPWDRLRDIWESTPSNDVENFIRRGLRHGPRHGQSAARVAGDELQGWVEVYLAYWNAVGEVLLVVGGNPASGQVCGSLARQAK